MKKGFPIRSFLGLALFGFSALAAPVAIQPIADAYVATGPTGNLSNNNYGGGGALAVSASGLTNGEFQSVLKFDLAGAKTSLDAQFGAGQWSIQSASLQLSSSPHNNAIYNDIAPGSFGVSLLQNSSWVEGTGNASNPSATGISYNTLQGTFISAGADQALGTFNFVGGSSGLNSYALTLSPGLTADILAGGTMSLRMFGADNQVSYLFSSRAATPVENQPQLIITPVPEPGTMALVGLAFGVVLLRSRRASFTGNLLKSPR